MNDPYSVLGVARDSDDETIKKAYKRLAKKYHPDISKEANADEKFKEVNAAFDVLKDPEKKKMYDTFGSTDGPPPGFGGGFGGGGPGGFSGFGGFEQGGGIDFEDVLSSMFGAGARGGGFHREARGRDQHTTMTLEPMLAITGGETTIVVPRGGGRSDTLKVRIPAGVEDGKTLRLRGQGAPPPRGGPAGDLHIKLQIPDHPRLRRRGKDLELDLPVTVVEAVRGAEVVAPTPTGEVKVRVPPGAKSGQKLRLKGRGVQAKSGHGDLFLVLQVQPPDVHSDAILEAIDALADGYSVDVRDSLKL